MNVNVGQFYSFLFSLLLSYLPDFILLPEKCSHPLPPPYVLKNAQNRVTYSIGLQGIVMFHQPQEMHSFWPSAALATGTDGSDETWNLRVTPPMPAPDKKGWPLTRDY